MSNSSCAAQQRDLHKDIFMEQQQLPPSATSGPGILRSRSASKKMKAISLLEYMEKSPATQAFAPRETSA